MLRRDAPRMNAYNKISLIFWSSILCLMPPQLYERVDKWTQRIGTLGLVRSASHMRHRINAPQIYYFPSSAETALAGSIPTPSGSTALLDLQTAKTWAVPPAQYRLANHYTKSGKALADIGPIVAAVLPLLEWSGSAMTLPRPAYQPRPQAVQLKWYYYRWHRLYYRLTEVDFVEPQIWRLQERH
jgi:hypothetical protein